MLGEAVVSWQLLMNDPEERGDVLSTDLLHENRLRLVASYASLPDTDSPRDGAISELFDHLELLSQRNEDAPRSLALSTLSVLCQSARGARLWAMSPRFGTWVGCIVDGIASTSPDLSISGMVLLERLVRLTSNATSTPGISFYPEEEAAEEERHDVEHGLACPCTTYRTHPRPGAIHSIHTHIIQSCVWRSM